MPGACTARCKPVLLAFHAECSALERRLRFHTNRRYHALLGSCQALNKAATPHCSSVWTCADLNWPVEPGGVVALR